MPDNSLRHTTLHRIEPGKWFVLDPFERSISGEKPFTNSQTANKEAKAVANFWHTQIIYRDIDGRFTGFDTSSLQPNSSLLQKAFLIKTAYRSIGAQSPAHLTPLFKWTGGKRREIELFRQYFPQMVSDGKGYTYVEPFVGGGAVYWYLNNNTGRNVINDFDEQVVNFYRVFKIGSSSFVNQLRSVSSITDHDRLEKAYYNQRNLDKNNGLKDLSDTEKAIRFFIITQLAFSGMRRFNAHGEFNVPFGHYKGLNTKLINSNTHKKLLSTTDIYQGDFEPIMREYDQPRTFVFLDPPYTRVFKEYSATNSFGEAEHKRLAEVISSMKNASVMMIIDRSTFTEKLYGEWIRASYPVQYGVNIRNRFNTQAEHLVLCKN